MRFKSKAVQVKITRSAQFSPVVRVFEHEVPVLQVVHGEENVLILPGKNAVTRVFDSRAERDRMVDKYPKVGDPRVSPVDVAYGNRMNSTLGKGLETDQAEPEDDPDEDQDESEAPAKPVKPAKPKKIGSQRTAEAA